MSLSLDEFSQTVEQLYAAAADPTLWGAALEAVEDLTGSAGAVVCFVSDQPERPPFVLAGRFTAEQCEEYARDYSPVCPRAALAKRRPDLPLHYDALLMTEAEMDRDPTYEWFEKRSGVRYYLGAAVMRVDGYHVNTSIQRTRAQGHVQKADLALYAKLRPHLVQALRLSNLIGTLATDRQIGLAALEHIGHGIVVLDGNGKLAFANAAADAMLGQDDGLQIVHGDFRATRAVDTRALRRVIASAALGEARRGGWLRVRRPSGRPDYLLFVAPLVTAQLSLGPQPPRVLVAIIDSKKGSALDGDALRSLFGLSAKQSEMAILLAAGQELSSIAAKLGIASDTARTHLKGIFRRLEVNRQQDLAALLAKLGAIRDPGRDGA